MLLKLWAFRVRDRQMAQSHRWTFVWSWAHPLAILFTLFFIGKLITGEGAGLHLSAYGGDYFRFALLGVALSGFTSAGMSSLLRLIAFERSQGTLEELFLARASFPALALGRVLWDLISVSARTAFLLFLGMLFFGIRFEQTDWPAVLPALLLTAGTFVGIGMLSAGFYLVWRENNPLLSLLMGASGLFSGVYFPVALLPAPLKILSSFLPLTYSLQLMRSCLLQPKPLAAPGREWGMLGGFCVLFLSLGLLFFRWSLRESKRQGTLGLD